MLVVLSPIASNRTTIVSVDGLVLTIDGVPIDLSVIPEGGYAVPQEGGPFVGKVTRELARVKYHYDSALAEPIQSVDWANYAFEVEDGVVPCPIAWKPVQEVDSVPND